MNNQNYSEGEQLDRNKNRSGRARKNYKIILITYVICLLSLIFIVVFKSEKNQQPVWFYWGIAIGAIYVLTAFLHFREHYLLPYLKDLEKPVLPQRRSIFAWISEWIAPAIVIQFLIVAFFMMTTKGIPLEGSLYTEPYMYGQVYKKMNNYLAPEVPEAGVLLKLGDIDMIKFDDRIKEKKAVIEKEFSQYIDANKLCKNDTDQCAKSSKPDAEMKGTEALSGKAPTPTPFAILKTIYHIPFYIALTFAFLGTMMYTLTDLMQRYYIADLYPKTFMGYTIRFLFAPAICMVIAYYQMNDWATNTAPILFFLIGFFPETAMKYVAARARAILGLKKEERRDVGLDRIQGMTDYNSHRLRELGYETAQHLAFCDINLLRKNWYNMRQLCDFIAQAILLINIQEYFSKLQDSGVRNAISFKHIYKNDDICREQAKEWNMPAEKLIFVRQEFNRSPLQERIDLLEMIMKKYENREKANAESWWGESAIE